MATVGDGGAPSQNTVNYDALLTTTMDAYVGGGSLFDNIFKDSAFLAFLRMSDAITKQNGGERIRAPLMYGKNSTVKSYSGAETLDTTLQDGITTAFYEWKEIGGTIGMTRKERRQNSGEAQMLELLESKVKQAEMSMREEVNKQLIQGTVSSATFIPGNDAKDLNPLGWFFRKANATDPTSGGNVGNIAGATYDWWRHQTATTASATKDTGNAFALNVTTWNGMRQACRRMYNFCARGTGGGPNVCLADQLSYEIYEAALDDKTRYMQTRMADLGFDSVRLKGAEMIWDEQVPDINNGDVDLTDDSNTDGTIFFLNTNFYKLIIDSETDMVTTPFVEPENQTVMTSKILFMGNAVVSNMRKHGVLYGIDHSIVS